MRHEDEDEEACFAAGVRQDLGSKIGRRIAPFYRTRTSRIDMCAPVVSFTFDDAPVSAATHGARLLEAYGARGTFYVSGGLAGRRWGPWTFADRQDIRRLIAADHEIGCHTYAHSDLQTLEPASILADIEANWAFLREMLRGGRPRNFAYPYGSLTIGAKRQVQTLFRSARGIRPGLNGPVLDLGQLKANRLYDALLNSQDVDRMIARAAEARGWLIFYTHGVLDQPTDQDTSRTLMEAALASCRRHGCEILTIDAALDRLGVERAKEAA